MRINEAIYNKMPKDLQILFKKLPNPEKEEVVDLFPNTLPSKSSRMGAGLVEGIGAQNLSPKAEGYESIRGHNDNGGSAARFFYCAKASKSERDRGCEGLEESMSTRGADGQRDKNAIVNNSNTFSRNNHPTVKPLKLMKYLVKLVTKEGQLVLEPFGGSGTTGIACKELNRKCIIIEKEEMYIPIIKARVSANTNNDVKDIEEDEIEEEKN